MALESGVVGLRQVGNVVELVDANGTPRIRATAPFVVDSAQTVREAKLAVSGCAVDLSSAAPWTRTVTLAGADTCRFTVQWDPKGLKAPLLVDPAWSATGAMAFGRTEAAGTLLSNGDVLVVGGTSADGLLAYQPVAELYNPALGTWAVTGSTHSAHVAGVAESFPNDGALVFGGSLSLLGDALCLLERREECAHDAEIYSVATGTWSTEASSSLIPLDTGMTATKLSSGKVLVVGGTNLPRRCTIYSASGAPVSCSKPPQGLYGHTATLLADGRVLVAGGLGARGLNRAANLFDPTKNVWSATGVSTSTRLFGISALLGDGRVLVTGGGVATAETYSPATATWTARPSMSAARLGATLTALPNGKVVAAGGLGATGDYLASAEEFDPASNIWSPSSTMVIGRTGHIATLLGDGQVLVATGSAASTQFLATSELYTSSAAPPPPPPNCDDGNICTTDTANTDGTCSHAPVANGAACSDGSACTLADSCQAGVCVGADPVVCTAEDACHVAGACNATSGVCSNPGVPDGTACSDGSACTTVDACSAGACVGSSPVICTAADSCHLAGACDSATGACTNPTAPNGTTCSDGNACTAGDACQAGACTAGTPTTCAAADACHVAGSCDRTSGACSNPPAPDGTTCSDGSSCTTGDACKSGSCNSGMLVTCTGGDSCHAAGSCDPITGMCSAPTATGGRGCVDAGAGAGADAGTDGGVGCASVDDHNSCTTDTCDVATNTASHTPIVGCGDPVAVVENAFETRASILGRAVTESGAPATQITATVFDGSTAGPARSDVQTTGSNGGFRIRLTSFPQATPFSATNAQRELVRLESAGTIPVLREAYVRPGDALDLGVIVLPTRDSQVTMIDAAGGTATDSRGLVEVQIPAGAVSTPTPIVLTPHLTREAVPFPLPDGTLTTYAMTMEPVGQTFATPVTVRLTNTRNLPPTMVIPAAYVDETTGRWLDAAAATWDGSKFSFTTSHFSSWDVNSGNMGILLYILTPGVNPAVAHMSCGLGSSVGVANGALGQSISLPMVQRDGAGYGVTLTYNSGLAGGFGDPGSQSVGGGTSTGDGGTGSGAGITTTSGAVTPTAAAAAIQGAKVKKLCLDRASADKAAESSPDDCEGGGCKLGGDPGIGQVSLSFGFEALGATETKEESSDAGAAEATFVPTIPVPQADDGSPAASFYARSTLTMTTPSTKNVLGCASGNSNGVPGPSSFFGSATGPGLTVTSSSGDGGTADMGTSGPLGALVNYTRSTFVRTLSGSPFGSGWGVAGVDQLYKSPWGDQAIIIGGDGTEEDFLSDTDRNIVGTGQLVTRDSQTGEILGISNPGQVAVVNATTGVATPVTSLALDSSPRAFGVAYVNGVRHYLVFTTSGLFDYDGAGSIRALYATSSPAGDPYFWSIEPSVTSQGSIVYFVAGRGDDTALRTLDLAVPGATESALTDPTLGKGSLTPTMPLGEFTFGDPHGVLWVDGMGLYVTDRQRDSLYLVRAAPGGTITPESTLDRVAGSGSSRFVPPLGERSPALQFPLNQPSSLSYADGVVWMASPFGIAAYDISSGDVRWAVTDDTLPTTQLTTSLFGLYNGLTPVSLVGLSATSPLWDDGTRLETFTPTVFMSERDPTRTLAIDATGATVTDITRDVTERFDSFGRLVEVRTRPGDLVNSYGYDGQSLRITTIADPSGSATSFTYDGSHRLAAITDAAGRITHLNNDGTLHSLALPDGETWSFTYDARGRMTQKTSPRGDSTTYDFDDQGVTATHKPATGDTYIVNPADAQPATYDATGQQLRIGSYTDPRGLTHTLTYNVYGDTVAESYVADGQSYNIVQNIPQYVDSQTGFTGTVLNARMQRISSTTVNGLLVTPVATYDALGRLVSSYSSSSFFGGAIAYDANGRVSLITTGYDSDGFVVDRDAAGRYAGTHEVLLQTNAADGQSLALTRAGPNGQVDTLTQHGLTTTLHFDGSGNITSSTDSLGRQSTITRDAAGQVIASNDGAVAWSFARDLANRVTSATDAAGGTTVFTYLQPGCGCSEGAEVASVHTPDLPASSAYTFVYGPEGRLAATTDPDGNVTSLGFEPTGELKQVLDALHHTTNLRHDSLGRVASSLDSFGRTSSSAYAYPTSGGYTNADITARGADATAVSLDPNASLADGAMQIGTRTYTTFREPLISFYRDATQAISFGHQWSGYHQLTVSADRSDVAYSSDTPYNVGPLFNEETGFDSVLPSDPPFEIESNAAGGSQSSTFGYDADRYLTSARGSLHPAATFMQWDTLGNDAAGRPTTMIGELAGSPEGTNGRIPVPSASFSYAPGVNQLSVVSDASGRRSFTYDTRGNVITLVAEEGTYSFAYDAVGRNAKVTFPDGHTRTQTFDHEGRLLLRCYGGYGGGLPDRCYSATYDAVGNPITVGDPEGTATLSYDGLDRLTSVVRDGVTESYAYNALGGLHLNAPDATAVQIDDQRPRLDGGGKASAGVPETLDGQGVTLDGVGRVTSLLGDTLTYDARGHVSSVTRADASVETYGYDPWLRRIARTQSAPATYGANEYDVYVGPNIGATIDPTGTPVRTWIFEGTDAPLRVTTVGQVAYYELDTTGNVRRLRGSGGADLGGYRYSAFGVAYPADGGTPAPTVEQPLRWKGRPYLEVGGGVYDMRARWWSPRLGAFLSADEFGYADPNSTLWGWGNQNPTRWSDPTGNCPWCLSAAGGALTGAAVGAVVGAVAQAYKNSQSAGCSGSQGSVLGAAANGAINGAIIGGAFGLNPYAGILAIGALGVQNENDLWKLGLGIGAIAEASATPAAVAAGDSVTVLNSSDVLFSQSSVNGVGPIADSMAANGWVGDPIDVVQTEDGLVTVDNTRLLAASMTDTPVQAVIHDSTDALPSSMAGRFVSGNGVEATTWGEAIQTRIGSQNGAYRSLFPGGSPATGVTN